MSGGGQLDSLTIEIGMLGLLGLLGMLLSHI